MILSISGETIVYVSLALGVIVLCTCGVNVHIYEQAYAYDALHAIKLSESNIRAHALGKCRSS